MSVCFRLVSGLCRVREHDLSIVPLWTGLQQCSVRLMSTVLVRPRRVGLVSLLVLKGDDQNELLGLCVHPVNVLKDEAGSDGELLAPKFLHLLFHPGFHPESCDGAVHTRPPFSYTLDPAGATTGAAPFAAPSRIIADSRSQGKREHTTSLSPKGVVVVVMAPPTDRTRQRRPRGSSAACGSAQCGRRPHNAGNEPQERPALSLRDRQPRAHTPASWRWSSIPPCGNESRQS